MSHDKHLWDEVVKILDYPNVGTGTLYRIERILQLIESRENAALKLGRTESTEFEVQKVLTRVKNHFGYSEDTNIRWSEITDYIDDIMQKGVK